MSDVTQILNAMQQGDAHAAGQLLPLVYDELRRLAAQKLAREKPGQTFEATALVHKKYAEAEPLLLQGYEGMKEREATIPASRKAYLSEAVERLVHLYDAWGQKDKAAQWRKIAEAGKSKQP